MIISYSVQATATPGQCTPYLLLAELRADAAFDATDIVGVSWTMNRPLGDEIQVEYVAPPSEQQLGAADAVVAAHEAA